MNIAEVEEIAGAVLYEGYMLYPYRASSVKNQQRWNFGVLCPRSYCDLQMGTESFFVQTQCLLNGGGELRLTVRVRFLQIVERLIGKFTARDAGGSERACDDLEFVDSLEADGRAYRPWQEAVERTAVFEDLDFSSLSSQAREFRFEGGESREEIRERQGVKAGVVVRRWQTLAGSVQTSAERCDAGAARVTVRVENLSEFDGAVADRRFGRDATLLHSLVSAHIVLGVEGGEFISLLEPAPGFEKLAAECKQVGAWPVLAGSDATTILASPIILYDYPKVAPESAGSLFDATEIDEILSLRILTLTDEEKAEIRQTDDRARVLLERTENIPDEQFMKLHGVVRNMTVLKEVPK